MIVVLSGQIASGKSTLARALHLDVLSTSGALRKRLPNTVEPSRASLQALGRALDRETNGMWILQDIEALRRSCVIDSVRDPRQLIAIRQFAQREPVVHVHLTASTDDRMQRFVARGGEASDFVRAADDTTEDQVPKLCETADLVIDTSRCSAEDVAARVLAAMRPRSTFTPNVDVIVGGQYGSEGKGHVVSHIAPDYTALVRVGGPNAGHTVINPENDQKVSFYHLPSGALHARYALLVLGPGAVINLSVLKKEAAYLGGLDQLAREHRLKIDPQANIISDEDIAAEAAVVKAIGSTGQGVGVATAGKILGRASERKLARDVEELRPFIHPTLDVLESTYRVGTPVLLEGTQGTGLSLHHGHYPYVTSRDTAASSTAGEAGIAPRRIRKSIIVMRTNPIRVQSPADGTSGPIGIELTWEQVAERSGVSAEELRKREMTTTTKRLRRVAEFCWSDLRRAVLLNSPTDIALTFTDYIDPRNSEARRWEQLTPETLRFIDEIERFAAAPVSLVTTRFHRRSILDRRCW